MVLLSGISSWDLYSKTDQYAKYVRNPNKTEKDTGKYFPRLTAYSRRFSQDANVRMEFSAPKLLYLNNLEELEDKDFPVIIETLQDRLREMGVVINKNILEEASVSSVHYSKNILLEDGYTVNHLINEMNKVNLRKSFDFTRSRYINDGQSLYAHTSAHELVIYDKIADLGKTKKRAMDKDQTLYQRSLFAELKKEGKMSEIVRFEIRLNQKQKMNQTLEKLGYKKNSNFKEVFSSEISKKVINQYWKTLIKDENLGIFSLQISIKDIIRILFLADTKLKPKQAVYLTGLFMLCKDENGMRELRSIISKRSLDRTWYRIANDIRIASELITKNKVRNWVLQIDKALEDYKPYKHRDLSTFKLAM
jgi:hypothetical protein